MMAEMLQVADSVAREKNIDREEVLDAMEQALVKLVAPSMAPSLISAPASTARAAPCSCSALPR